jgi:hypothetical protein
MTLGRCKGKAHQPEHLGIAGRRMLVSRKWSNKTLNVSLCSTSTPNSPAADIRGSGAKTAAAGLTSTAVSLPVGDRV